MTRRLDPSYETVLRDRESVTATTLSEFLRSVRRWDEDSIDDDDSDERPRARRAMSDVPEATPLRQATSCSSFAMTSSTLGSCAPTSWSLTDSMS